MHNPVSLLIRFLFVLMLKLMFRFYVKLNVVGDINKVLDKHPKMLFISNHTSHLDAVAITAMLPFSKSYNLYITAAKDYFFKNPFISFFSKYCIQAFPVDRSDEGGSDTFRMCLSLLNKLETIWLLIFPEGTRSLDGKVHRFKRGTDIISKKTGIPVLFLFVDGAFKLWPKNGFFAKYGGKMTVYVGPVFSPESEDIYDNYKSWVDTIKPNSFYLDS